MKRKYKNTKHVEKANQIIKINKNDFEQKQKTSNNNAKSNWSGSESQNKKHITKTQQNTTKQQNKQIW